MQRRAFFDAALRGLVAGLPAFAFLWLKGHPEVDHSYAVPTGHFYVVSVVSVMSAALALISAAGAVRTANARIVLLALSFTTMAGMFAVHGLATPGFLVDRQFTAVLGFSARMSLLLSATFLALSAVDLPKWANEVIVRHRVPILGGAVIAVLGYGAGGLMWPEYIPPRVMSEQLFLRGTLAVVLALSLYAAVRYYEGYRRAALTLYGAVALGSLLLFEAQVAMRRASDIAREAAARAGLTCTDVRHLRVGLAHWLETSAGWDKLVIRDAFGLRRVADLDRMLDPLRELSAQRAKSEILILSASGKGDMIPSADRAVAEAAQECSLRSSE